MRKSILLMICFVNSLSGYSQNKSKPVVGVTKFTSEVDSKYATAVEVKVAEIITATKRFTVVDRINYDKVKEELEFQKTEAFLDSKNTAKQDVALAAKFLVIGHVMKFSIYNFKNPDGTTSGYRASTAFTLKVNNVETGETTEAESFQTEVSPIMLSPESAVNEALKSVEAGLNSYVLKKFPLMTKIRKVLTTKKEAAATVLIAGGKSYGFKEGDKLTVEKSELIDGKPYPSKIGQIKVVKVAGDDFSECSVSDGGKEMLDRFNGGETLTCTLITK